MQHGMFEAAATVRDGCTAPAREPASRRAKPPHILLVHDESSFDIRACPGIKLPQDYGAHFRSFDGKTRSLLVEATGGPTWYTEYNLLTGPVGALLRQLSTTSPASRPNA